MAREMSAGGVLRDARQRAGLSQTELAARAGVAQSVVSVYESGRRQPSVLTLAALVAATGHELELAVRPARERAPRLSGPVGRTVRRHRAAVLRIAANHGSTILGVFGSAARGEDRADSDLDLLVELPVGMGLLGIGRFRQELEDLLGVEVDLVPVSDLKPGVRRAVYTDLVPL